MRVGHAIANVDLAVSYIAFHITPNYEGNATEPTSVSILYINTDTIAGQPISFNYQTVIARLTSQPENGPKKTYFDVMQQATQDFVRDFIQEETTLVENPDGIIRPKIMALICYNDKKVIADYYSGRIFFQQ